MVWFGIVYLVVRYSMVWCGMVWCGVVRYVISRDGMAWHGVVRYGIIRHGMRWHGSIWHGMRRYGMVYRMPRAVLTSEGLSRVLLPDDAGVDRLIRRARGEGKVILPIHILFVDRAIRRDTCNKRYRKKEEGRPRSAVDVKPTKLELLQPFASEKCPSTFTS